ncbi:MAG: 3',5'-cyclic-nucleotide phosphodiesterase [Bdellovibrio sp.]|nr:3',5'-cyclic-nucleotide phosphodiesterase [Bdellovibrio sp.]
MIVRIIGGHGGVCPGFRATSYLIDGKLMIDAGSVASGLLIDEQLQIDNILISHPHLDHINELAFLSDNCFGMKNRPYEIYSNKEVIDAIRKHLINDVIWPDFSKLPNEKNPTLRFHEIQPEVPLMLDDYKIFPIHVNHFGGAFGFIIERKGRSVLFTQDTGPTERIWEVAKTYKNLKAIFTEVSFPSAFSKVAQDSKHHTPMTIDAEIAKMPKDIPIFLGHLKPNYQAQLFQEIEALGNDRISIMGTDDTSFVF